MVERIPLTKRPDSSVEYSLASSTASSITTARRRPVGVEQLGDGQPQHNAVDHGHAVERPAHRGPGDAAVRLLPGGDGVLDEGPHVRVGRDGKGVDDLERPLALELGLVEQGERALALLVAGGGVGHVRLVPSSARGCGGSARRPGRQARVRYSPERVSTLITSPMFTKRGTWTT